MTLRVATGETRTVITLEVTEENYEDMVPLAELIADHAESFLGSAPTVAKAVRELRALCAPMVRDRRETFRKVVARQMKDM